MTARSAGPSSLRVRAPVCMKPRNFETSTISASAAWESRAVANVIETIAPAVIGFDLDDQEKLDATLVELDGTPDKSRLGANALLAVSLAMPHAAAASRKEELYAHFNRLWTRRLAEAGLDATEPTVPLPMVNMISGGLHAGRNLDIQDVLIIPLDANDYPTALENVAAVRRALRAILRERGEEADLIGDEGGFGPKLKSNEQAIERVVEAIVACGMEPRRDMAIALDIAASHFFDPATATYRLHFEGIELSARHSSIALKVGLTLIQSFRSRTVWPRTTGRVGAG